MYLASLRLQNFRSLGHSDGIESNDSDFVISFHKGLNVLVGRNDEGKSAIIDAIKIVLKTHSLDKNRIEQDDFYYDKRQGVYANHVKIELTFRDLSDTEGGKFIEWLTWITSENNTKPELRVIYEAYNNDGKIIPSDIKAGAKGNETYLDAEAREFLRITYLKPLRDAENELRAKRNSRLSQILLGHSTFKEGSEGYHKIIETLKKANDEISSLLNEEKSNFNIKGEIDRFLRSFIGDEQEASILMSPPHIRKILENLDISLNDGINHGLGTLNRLYMATELMHLEANRDRLPLCLIEELEAHLHPQAQMKVVNTLLKLTSDTDNQFIITTHSPNISSRLPLASLILIDNGNAFPLAEEYTKLSKADYYYLQLFLDTTKANLFYAKGIILVEGWSEMLFIPAIARFLGIDLTAAEVSIINVENTGYLHYAKIFQRNSSPKMNIKVAIISDLDMPPKFNDGKIISPEETDVNDCKNKKIEQIQIAEDENIKVFFSTPWTLEWSIANSFLSEILHTCLKEVHKNLYKECTNWKEVLYQQLSAPNVKEAIRLENGSCASNLDKTRLAYVLAREIQNSKQQSYEKDSLQYILDALHFVSQRD